MKNLFPSNFSLQSRDKLKEKAAKEGGADSRDAAHAHRDITAPERSGKDCAKELPQSSKTVRQVQVQAGRANGDSRGAGTDSKSQYDKCSISDFTQGPILGTGSFGRVLLASHRQTGKICAIKALSKAHLVRNQQVAHLKAERDVLRLVCHPGLVNYLGGFQDGTCVYFIMEYVSGGEFFRHLKMRGKLSEDIARFYAAEVLDAFEYLHGLDIVYRDLKPENLLLDASGHMKVTDLGFAKVVGAGKRTYTLCGTPDYLAPEIILNKGHGTAVDWWAYGVFLYEMMAGFPPFYDDDPTSTYKKILAGRFAFPSHFSSNARDLIRKLLQDDLSKRYGCLANGVNDIKSHAFFKGIDWSRVARREDPPPIRPVVKSADDRSNFDDYGSLGPMKHEFELSMNEQAMFAGF